MTWWIRHPVQDTGAFALAQALKANGEAAVSTLNLTSNFLTKYGQVDQHSHLLPLFCYLFVLFFGNSRFGPQMRLFSFEFIIYTINLNFVYVSYQYSWHSCLVIFLVHAGRPDRSEGSCKWNERRKGSQYIFLERMRLTICPRLLPISTKGL